MNRLFALSGAVALLSHPALIIIFGALVLRGNSVATCAALIVPLGLIAFASNGGAFDAARREVSRSDLLFLAFVAAVAASFLATPLKADAKEIVLLGITLSAYAACRRVSAGQLEGLSQAIFWGALTISAIGFAATLPLLTTGWGSPNRPAVFGFFHSTTLFAIAAGLLAISSATTRLPRKWVFYGSSLVLACSVAVFAACFVRFVFVAIVASLLVGALVSRDATRWRFLINAGIVCFAVALGYTIALGYTVNPYKASMMTSYTVGAIEAGSGVKSGCGVDENNSVALRRKLIGEFVESTPRYGLVGFGLDSFQSRSCLAMPPHNSFIQAFFEFGFLGGGSLILLVGTVLAQLFRVARGDQRTVIVLCTLVLFVALDMAYGRLSRDIQTFALIGMSVALIQQARRQSAFPELRPPAVSSLWTAARSIAIPPRIRANELHVPTAGGG